MEWGFLFDVNVMLLMLSICSRGKKCYSRGAQISKEPIFEFGITNLAWDISIVGTEELLRICLGFHGRDASLRFKRGVSDLDLF